MEELSVQIATVAGVIITLALAYAPGLGDRWGRLEGDEKRLALSPVGSSQRSLNTPAAPIKPPGDVLLRYTCLSGPLSYRLTLPVEFENSIATLVVRLHYPGGPSAIVGRIVTVVVNAVQGVFARWTWPHVRVERLEGFAPTRTDLNAAAAIIRVFPVVRVIASAFHGLPGVMFWRARHAVRGTCCDRCGYADFPVVATATNDSAAAQTITSYAFHSTARTSAIPISTPSLCVRKPNDNKATKALAANIFDLFGDGDKLVISHVTAPISNVVREALGRYSVRRFSHFNSLYGSVQNG